MEIPPAKVRGTRGGRPSTQQDPEEAAWELDLGGGGETITQERVEAFSAEGML
jgi:hypothetical protein